MADCPHNVTPFWESVQAWNGPIGKCSCCGHEFGYIDSGSYSHDRQEVTMNDPNLCPPCGGLPRRHIVEKGTTVLIEPGTRLVEGK